LKRYKYAVKLIITREFEDTKGVIRSCKSNRDIIIWPMVDKTLHRKLKIEQHKPIKNWRWTCMLLKS